ncbi:phage portal protein [Lentzea sp. NBRC 105346]|uniref:phage portal protein n=1 Tax=Lentzea sp. NBRC 105346 TaxID=3032205 RepID=UPI002555F3D5|nr:phage portal protein [Lentzea sp. NBRC 105346]
MLIEPGSQWPPPGHWKIRHYWQSWSAYWSGDLAALKTYGSCTAPGGYWARMKAKPGNREIHVPIAADIARTSAELVAGDTPVIDWEDQQAETADSSNGNAPRRKSPLQDTWDNIAQTIGWANKLLQGAEIGSPIGGWYLRAAWDERLGKRPLLTVVRGDEALPMFLFDELIAVTFVQELDAPQGWKTRSDGEVFRWLEHHEPGQIRHELWLGSTSNVGDPLPLTEHPTTAGFLPVIDTSTVRPNGILVEHVPNDLPMTLDVLPLGRSDLQGVETLLDALDEAMASWMQDIELAKARILASKEMLDPVTRANTSSGAATGFFGSMFGRRENTNPARAFDTDAKVFTPLEMPAEDGGKVAPITLVQFAIRFQEHEATVLQLIEQIVSRAGYAPQTFGMHVEGQLSGTAMRRREQKSYRTRDRKRRYMRPALERIAETLMLLNAVLNPDAPRPTQRPTLVWRETDQSDPLEMAQVVELLSRARAASKEVLVKAAHPEWDDTQVGEEVKRLMAEDAGMMAPAPTGFESPVGPVPQGNGVPSPNAGPQG